MRNKYKNMIEDFSSFGIDLTDKQLVQFNTYYELLVEWNKVMNLTAITEFDDVCKLHFVDSISSAKFFDFTKSDLIPSPNILMAFISRFESTI